MAFAFPATWAPQLRSLLRFVAGAMFMLHGTGKILGWPDPKGKLPEGAATLFQASGYIELICGALIAVGLLTSLAAFIASGEMAVAYFMKHYPDSFWPTMNHGENAVLYCFVFLYLAFAGPGPWSIDAMFSRGRRHV